MLTFASATRSQTDDAPVHAELFVCVHWTHVCVVSLHAGVAPEHSESLSHVPAVVLHSVTLALPHVAAVAVDVPGHFQSAGVIVGNG